MVEWNRCIQTTVPKGINFPPKRGRCGWLPCLFRIRWVEILTTRSWVWPSPPVFVRNFQRLYKNTYTGPIHGHASHCQMTQRCFNYVTKKCAMISVGICTSRGLSSAQCGAQPFPGLQDRCSHRHIVLEVLITSSILLNLMGTTIVRLPLAQTSHGAVSEASEHTGFISVQPVPVHSNY